MVTTNQPITVLIVDDAPDMRRTIQDILSFEPDFEIVGMASNGVEGLEMALEIEPDVVLMNNSMPVMSGLEATDKIKRVAPHICVIMLSTDNGASARRMASSVGAFAYFVSPLMDFDELYEAIREGAQVDSEIMISA